MTAAVRGLDGSRTIVRRRALPSGRAVTGGFLMALAALGVFVAARGAGQPATQNYVVVAHDVAAGTTLAEADLAIACSPTPARPGGACLHQPASVVGQSPSPIWLAGDLVQASTVVGW